MADEGQANQARQKHGSDLVKRGVHAIAVEEGKPHGKKGWVVVAHIRPRQHVKLPSSLPLSGGVDVPLVVAESEPFAPE